jgi:hypothetical protein
LDGLGFIQSNKGQRLYDIVAEHKSDESLPYEKSLTFDLKKYVHITEDGKKYLRTLNNILKTAKEPIREKSRIRASSSQKDLAPELA